MEGDFVEQNGEHLLRTTAKKRLDQRIANFAFAPTEGGHSANVALQYQASMHACTGAYGQEDSAVLEDSHAMLVPVGEVYGSQMIAIRVV